MKNKIIALVLALAATSTLLCSCGEEARDSEFYPYAMSDYVELGDYMNIEYTEKKVFVTETDVNLKIESELKKYGLFSKKEKDDVAMVGDIVNIDYAGYLDGVAFSGGTAAGHDLELGSGSFIDGFEDGLVGKRAGDKVDLNLTFPEQYHSEQLAGKSVVFKVTVNKVYKIVYDEVTDENVSGISNVTKASKYRDYIYNMLLEEETAEVNNANYSAVVAAVIKCSKIKKYPEKEVEDYKKSLISQNERIAQSQGMTLERLVSYSGYTMDEFEALMEENAKKMVAKEMLFLLIAEKEGVKISTREYKKSLEKYMEEQNFSSEEELLSAIGEERFIGLLTVDKAVTHLQKALTQSQE